MLIKKLTKIERKSIYFFEYSIIKPNEVRNMMEEKNKIENIINEVEKVIVGKRDVIQLTVTAILAEGHILFEDIPGVGKTMLVKTMSKVLDSHYNRVQFTPDLLPSDVIGVSIFDQRDQEFKFHQGPIFTSLFLADEINRSTPKTQAALLEAMEEKKVTVDNQTYSLSPNFCVLATQNPLEFEGTYSLPEAQLDRFLFRLSIGYPKFEEELDLILGGKREEIFVRSVIDGKELLALKGLVNEVYIHPDVAKYALNLVQATRNHDGISLGISPRGSLAFVKASRAYALTEGRNYVTPKDLQKILPACFGHRIKLKQGLKMNQKQLEEILAQIIQRVPIPTMRKNG